MAKAKTQKPLSEQSDEELVRRYRAGEDAAFETLVDRYRKELFPFLMRFVGRRAAAEDVFQEAFLQVHLSIDSFDTSRRFKPWLFTIAANKARDYLRRKSTRTAAQLTAPVDADEEGGKQFLDLMQDDLPLPEAHAMDNETKQLVRETVESLPDHLREILLLAYFHRFPYKEIAQMLNVPLGTVKSRLHAAVGTFGTIWKKRFEQQNQP